MDYPQASQALMERADALMAHAPGRVAVRRISHIDEVRVLRQARQALTAEENQELKRARLMMMERLDGARAAIAPEKTDPKKGLFGALLSPLIAIAKGFSTAERQQAEYSQMVRQAGGSAILPAPPELLDAAEAWLISQLVADRIEGDASVLRRPWEEATIDPVA